jgi:hypothetical protein
LEGHAFAPSFPEIIVSPKLKKRSEGLKNSHISCPQCLKECLKLSVPLQKYENDESRVQNTYVILHNGTCVIQLVSGPIR